MPKHERKTVEILDTKQNRIYLGKRQLSIEERLSRQIRGQYRDVQNTEEWEKSEERMDESTDFDVPEKTEHGEGYEIANVEKRLSDKAEKKRAAKLEQQKTEEAAKAAALKEKGEGKPTVVPG